jgi:ATP-binding cassette, subfamily B, bacterial HlyB/CyaB
VPDSNLAIADAAVVGGSPAGESSLLACLVIAARRRGIHLSVAQLVHDHLLDAGEPSVAQLLRIARACGLRAQSVRVSWRDLFAMKKVLPAIVLLRDGSAMVLAEVQPEGRPPHVALRDPNAHEDALVAIDEERFAAAASGEVILIKRDYRLLDDDQPFGVWMIAGQLLRDRGATRDIAICAVALSFLAVLPILFWRLLIDRVLYYQSLDTFAVLCVVFLVLLVFDTLFGYLRRYLVVRTATRFDAKMSTFLFDKVLNLPVDYFERTPSGIVARDMNEFQRIRNFLLYQLFGTALDMIVLFVFLPIMFAFSPILTAAVLGVSGLICLWIVAMLPVLRRKTLAVFQAEGSKGAFLIESLHGIRAIKSLALDARHRHEWDVRVARAARARFAEGCTANVIQTVIHPLQLLMTNGVFAIAVYMTITTGDMVYVGALIAFMMLTNRVAAPLVQAAQLLQQFDETRLATAALANLVNQPPEEGRSRRGIRTPLVGRVEFSDVRFRYRGTTTPALDRVSFTIPQGTIFGIMGRSGSGKTTVTRLLQLLHANFEGLIKIDGNDLREIDVDHLRASLGVVLQENFLFTGTIRETIAAAKPDATFEEVVRAARLAGAEEFIERLPRGYETVIQEGSSNLSGGQRQRLAIARALIGDPRILILDEATSALDAESEAIVNANLLRIAKDRTLIIISHRLSSLVTADAILVLERGKVHDIGRHDELLARCEIYSGLWHQQHRHLLPRSSNDIIPLRPGAAS